MPKKYINSQLKKNIFDCAHTHTLEHRNKIAINKKKKFFNHSIFAYRRNREIESCTKCY
jgi:hypothetical protein